MPVWHMDCDQAEAEESNGTLMVAGTSAGSWEVLLFSEPVDSGPLSTCVAGGSTPGTRARRSEGRALNSVLVDVPES